MVGVNIPVVKVRFSREAMTEQQWKNLGSLLACAAILALIALVLIQQSWVNHRPVEAAILPAGVFARAKLFSSRMSNFVHSRRLDLLLAIFPFHKSKKPIQTCIGKRGREFITLMS